MANGMLSNTCFSSHASLHECTGLIRSTPFYYLGVLSYVRSIEDGVQDSDSVSTRKVFCDRLCAFFEFGLTYSTLYEVQDNGSIFNHGSMYMHKFISFP